MWKLTIKDSDFSSQQELFFQFEYGGKTYHTMPKDGEGKHAIWEQPFELKEDAEAQIVLKACEGSPLENKQIGKTEAILANKLIESGDSELRLINEEKEDIGYVNVKAHKIEEAE